MSNALINFPSMSSLYVSNKLFNFHQSNSFSIEIHDFPFPMSNLYVPIEISNIYGVITIYSVITQCILFLFYSFNLWTTNLNETFKLYMYFLYFTTTPQQQQMKWMNWKIKINEFISPNNIWILIISFRFFLDLNI